MSTFSDCSLHESWWIVPSCDVNSCGSVCMYGLLRASELSLQLEWIFPCWLRVDSGWENSEYVLAPYRRDCRPLICINQLVHSTSPSGGLSLSLNKPHYLLHWYSPFFFLSHSAAYLNTGIVLMDQGRLEEAKRTFVTCAEIPDENLKDPHAHKSSVTSCLYNLGKLLHEQGHQEVSWSLHSLTL